jgi:hypothetical protein
MNRSSSIGAAIADAKPTPSVRAALEDVKQKGPAGSYDATADAADDKTAGARWLCVCGNKGKHYLSSSDDEVS